MSTALKSLCVINSAVRKWKWTSYVTEHDVFLLNHILLQAHLPSRVFKKTLRRERGFLWMMCQRFPNKGCSGNRLKAQESEDKTTISLTELPQNNRQAGNVRDRLKRKLKLTWSFNESYLYRQMINKYHASHLSSSITHLDYSLVTMETKCSTSLHNSNQWQRTTWNSGLNNVMTRAVGSRQAYSGPLWIFAPFWVTLWDYFWLLWWLWSTHWSKSIPFLQFRNSGTWQSRLLNLSEK